ncbi:MAG: hypothetical protein ACI38Z_05345 [Parafannyhessea sp.]|uniref:hypothetical protein n=1 Tax=Parafannyhessea sp. TaxID=2847324 RepID=UPI003EFF7127
MARYVTYTEVADLGPYVRLLMLEEPTPVDRGLLAATAFEVRSRADGTTDGIAVPVLRAFACDAAGEPVGEGATSALQTASYVALELPECEATRTVGGNVMGSFRVRRGFCVTQSGPVGSVTFDEPAGDRCPALDGWDLGLSGTFDGYYMRYALFSPKAAGREAGRGGTPLLLWLHGAGEAHDPWLSVMANRVTALGLPRIQRELGGAAYVLVPASPTYWMDSGSGMMEDDNRSRYTVALRQLVDSVVAAHPDVDRSRVYVGGLSNGGFMTCRLIADYPGYFAAGIALCAPWNEDLATEAEFRALARTPLWFVHSKDDPIVDPDRTAIPNFRRLRAMGAPDVHLTLLDHVVDQTGRYLDAQGRPMRFNGHFVWIPAYNDQVRETCEGPTSQEGGRALTLWEWVGSRRLPKPAGR